MIALFIVGFFVSRNLLHLSCYGLAMATSKGSSSVANAIKDIEIEKVQGPADAKTVKVGIFWENQVSALLKLLI